MIAKMFKPRTGPRTSKQYTVWRNFWLSLIPQIAAQGLIAPGLMVSLIPYSYVAVISPVRAALKTRLSVSLPSPPRLIFHSLAINSIFIHLSILSSLNGKLLFEI